MTARSVSALRDDLELMIKVEIGGLFAHLETSAREPDRGHSLEGHPMTGHDIRAARGTLGELWGLGRPSTPLELARALRLRGRDPGATVLAWESGTPISGPVSVAIEMMLAGARPPIDT